MVANETTVLVPVDNVDGVGLRRAINDEEIERLFTLLGDGKIDNHQNWKGRFKDNSDRMRTGSIYDVVEVLKSLTFLARSKNLSFREKRMLDRAKFLVISEISEVVAREDGADRREGRSRARALLHDEEPVDRARQGRQGRTGADDARVGAPDGPRLLGRAFDRHSQGKSRSPHRLRPFFQTRRDRRTPLDRHLHRRLALRGSRRPAAPAAGVRSRETRDCCTTAACSASGSASR